MNECLCVQAQVDCVGVGLPASEPGGPSEAASGAKLQPGNIVALEPQTHVPVEFETQIQPHPVHELDDQPASGQKAFVLFQGERTEVNPELVLAIPHAASDDRPGAKHRPGASETRALVLANEQPVADELFDSCGYP